jgi:hypothetical protein
MMMRKVIVLLASIALVFLALSVVWFSFADNLALSLPVELQTDLPGKFGYSVYQLADGSLVLNSANSTCTFLVKLDSLNQLIWEKPIQVNSTITILPRLLPTAEGGFILGGIVNNSYILVKTDSEGNTEWTNSLSSGAPINYFMSIVQTKDGGFAIAGFGEPVEESLGWIWLAKTDTYGNMEWNKTISGPLSDCPSSIFQTPDGGFVLSEVSYSFVPDQAFFRLLKLDSAGNMLESTVYGGDGYYYQPECNFALSTRDGGYLMAGYLWEKSAWAVKTDRDGIMQWNQTYGAKHSSITCALEIPNGYLLTSISNLTDVGLIMTDALGNQLYNTTFPDVRLPVGLEANFNTIISSKSGGYIMVGSKNDSVWLVKLDIQHGAPISLSLLSCVGVVLALVMVAIVLVVAKIGKGKRKQKVGGTDSTQ